MSVSEDTIHSSFEAIEKTISRIDEMIRKTEDQAETAYKALRALKARRFVTREMLRLRRDQECEKALRELPDATLKVLPRELRDMVYLELYRGSQDEPYVVVDNNSRHPHHAMYEFAPMVKGYYSPYWMLERQVGHEFAQEAVEAWYTYVLLSVDIKLLQPLLQDSDGVLYDSWAPSVRTCDFLRNMQVAIGPALEQDSRFGRPTGRAVHIRKICRSLSALLEEPGIAKKKGFELHVAFRWYSVDDWPSYLEAVCPVVYRLKAHGFLVTSSQAYGQRMTSVCDEEDCFCRDRRLGEIVWHLSEHGNWFDCSEEDCMKKIEGEKVRREW